MTLTKEIYTTREVAGILNLIPGQIRTDIKTGKLKAEKFGTSYVITKNNLADYLELRKARGYGKK